MGNSTHSLREVRQRRPRTVPRDPSIIPNHKEGEPSGANTTSGKSNAVGVSNYRQPLDTNSCSKIRAPSIGICCAEYDASCCTT